MRSTANAAAFNSLICCRVADYYFYCSYAARLLSLFLFFNCFSCVFFSLSLAMFNNSFGKLFVNLFLPPQYGFYKALSTCFHMYERKPFIIDKWKKQKTKKRIGKKTRKEFPTKKNPKKGTM